MESLLQLDDRVRPGVPAEKFASLFVQCRCGIVTTNRAFEFHICLRPQVIDLTVEPETDDMVIDLTQDD